MHLNKSKIACSSVFLLLILQTVNLIYTIGKIEPIQYLCSSTIDQILKDSFICRSNTTPVYNMYNELFLSNIMNMILLIGTIAALVVFFKYTKSKSAIALLLLNSALFLLTVVPFVLAKFFGLVINVTVLNFAFLTVNLQKVPFMLEGFVVLIIGYLVFFVSCIYKKHLSIFTSVLILAALQAANLIYIIVKMEFFRTLFISSMQWLSNGDATLVYYLFQQLHPSNVINAILTVAVIIALAVYFHKTKSITAIILICLNAALFCFTVIPSYVERYSDTIPKMTGYYFAFYTADYKTVPAVIAVYAVLAAGYLFYFASCLYRYLKKRKAVPAN